MQDAIETASRWEWMRGILAGEGVSDFAESFPEIRQLIDLMDEAKRLRAMVVYDCREPGVCPDVCTMCISTKRGPARIASDTIGDITAQYLKLEDGSGIGMNEADLYVRGLRQGLQKAAEIAETHQSQELEDGCGTGRFIARTLREFAESV